MSALGVSLGEAKMHLSTDMSRFSAGAITIRKGMDDIQRKVRQTDTRFGKLSTTVDALSSKLIHFGRNYLLMMTVPLVIMGQRILQTAGQFQTSMNRVRALTEATGKEFVALRTQALDLGRTTQFTARDAAEAMGFLAQAGHSVQNIIGAMPSTLLLAASAMLDMSTSADIVTNILAGFNKDVSELPQAVDVLVKAFTSANTNLQQLAYAMKYVGPVAQAAGFSFEETTAAVALLGNAGIQATMAGTSLRGAITRLLRPIGEAKQSLRRLGIEVRTEEGAMKSLVGIVREFKEALDRVGGSAAAAPDLIKILGLRAGPGFLALISQGPEKFLELVKKLEGATGHALHVAKVQMEGYIGALRRVQSTTEAVAITLGFRMLPAFEAVSKKIVEINTHLVEMAPAKQGLLLISAGFLALVPLFSLFGGAMLKLLKAFVNVRSWLIVLGLAFGALALSWASDWDKVKPILVDMWTVFSESRLGSLVINIFNGIREAVIAVSPVLLAYGAALLTVGRSVLTIRTFIISFIVSLGYLMLNLLSDGDKIKAFFSDIGNVVKQAWSDTGDWFSELWNEIKRTGSDIFDWFTSLPERITHILSPKFDNFIPITSIWETISSKLTHIWDNLLIEGQAFIRHVFEIDYWSAIRQPLVQLWESIALNLQLIWGTLLVAGQAFIRQLFEWEPKKQYVIQKWEELSLAIKSIWTSLKTDWHEFTLYLSEETEYWKQAAQGAWDKIALKIKDVWVKLKTAWKSFSHHISEEVDYWKHSINNAWDWIALNMTTSWAGMKTAWESFTIHLSEETEYWKQTVQGAWNEIASKVKAQVKAIWTGLKADWHAFTLYLSEETEYWKQAVLGAWDDIALKIKDIWTDLKTDWKSLTIHISEETEYWKQAVLGAWDEISSKIKAMWDDLSVQWQEFVQKMIQMKDELVKAFDMTGLLGWGDSHDTPGLDQTKHQQTLQRLETLKQMIDELGKGFDQAQTSIQKYGEELEKVNQQAVMTSHFRTPEKNAALPGSSSRSSHLFGGAIDYGVAGNTSEGLARLYQDALKVRDIMNDVYGIQLEVVDELDRHHVHIQITKEAKAELTELYRTVHETLEAVRTDVQTTFGDQVPSDIQQTLDQITQYFLQFADFIVLHSLWPQTWKAITDTTRVGVQDNERLVRDHVKTLQSSFDDLSIQAATITDRVIPSSYDQAMQEFVEQWNRKSSTPAESSISKSVPSPTISEEVPPSKTLTLYDQAMNTFTKDWDQVIEKFKNWFQNIPQSISDWLQGDSKRLSPLRKELKKQTEGYEFQFKQLAAVLDSFNTLMPGLGDAAKVGLRRIEEKLTMNKEFDSRAYLRGTDEVRKAQREAAASVIPEYVDIQDKYEQGMASLETSQKISQRYFTQAQTGLGTDALHQLFQERHQTLKHELETERKIVLDHVLATQREIDRGTLDITKNMNDQKKMFIQGILEVHEERLGKLVEIDNKLRGMALYGQVDEIQQQLAQTRHEIEAQTRIMDQYRSVGEQAYDSLTERVQALRTALSRLYVLQSRGVLDETVAQSDKERQAIRDTIGVMRQYESELDQFKALQNIHDLLEGVKTAFAQSMNQMVRGVAQGTQSIGQLMHNMVQNIVLQLTSQALTQAFTHLIDMLWQVIQVKMLASSTAGSGGGIIGSILSTAFGALSGTSVGTASAGATAAAASAPTLLPDKWLQHGGPLSRGEVAVVGEAGPEVFVPSQSGHVFPNAGQGRAMMPVAGGTMVNLKVVVNNYSKEPVQTRQRTSGRDEEIEVMVGAAVAENIRKGGRTAQTIEKIYGVKRTGGLRA